MGGKKPIGVDPSRGNCRSRRGRRQNPTSLFSFNSPTEASKLDIMENDYSLFSSMWILDPSSATHSSDADDDDVDVKIKQKLLFESNMDGEVEVFQDPSQLDFIGTDSFPEYDEPSFSTSKLPDSHRRIGDTLYLLELESRVIELTALVGKLQSQISQISQVHSISYTSASAELAPIGPSRTLSKSSSAASLQPPPQRVDRRQQSDHLIGVSPSVSPSSSVGSELHHMPHSDLLQTHSSSQTHPRTHIQPLPVLTSAIEGSSDRSDPLLSKEDLTKILDRISTLEGRHAFVQSKISQLDAAFGGPNPAAWRKASKQLQGVLFGVVDVDGDGGMISNGTPDQPTSTEASIPNIQNNIQPLCALQEEESLNASANLLVDSKKKKSKKKKQSQEAQEPCPMIDETVEPDSSKTLESVARTSKTSSQSQSQSLSQGPETSHGSHVTTSVLSPSPSRARTRDAPWNGSNSVRRWHRHDADSTVATTGSTINVMYMSPSQICYYYPMPQYSSTAGSAVGVQMNQYPYPSFPYMYQMVTEYQTQVPQQLLQQDLQQAQVHVSSGEATD